MTSVLEKVWSYRTFKELEPSAAKRAIKDDTLFSNSVLWGQSMDPQMVDTLFYPDGSPALLTITERLERFPSPIYS